MSVLRRFNALSALRVQTSDLLAVESAVSSDFDQLAQALFVGTSSSYVLRGFFVVMSNAIGGAASSLQLYVDGAALYHPLASQSGTTFLVPSGTANQQLNSAINPNVSGAFTPNSTNYVGIDYNRFAASSTNAQSYFWSVASSSELIQTVPKAILMEFEISITSTVPPANILPIAIIVTDSGNNVLSVRDCRPLYGRLGQGGWNPNPFSTYNWPQGQLENAGFSTSNSLDPFFGGDKSIGTQKDKDDAICSQIKSIIGGTYWYTENDFGSLSSLREDLGNTLITGSGFIEHSATAAGQINWNENIYVKVVGSSLSYQLTANASSTDIVLTDDECAYVTLVRGVLISPNLNFTNGSAVVTSVGAVAWTSLLQSGDFVKLASSDDSGYYEIDTVNSLSQVTLVENFAGTSTGAGGAQAEYAFGSYTTSPTPSTNRNIYIADRADVPSGADVFWLFLRADNAGAIPRVYIRFLSTELSQGESEDISDPLALEFLKYCGSPNEAAYAPQYATKVDDSAVPQITDIQVGAESTITQSAYFTISSSGNYRKYYVWFNENGGGTDPTPSGIPLSIEIDIVTGQTAAQVATALMNGLNGTEAGDFIATIESGHTDTVVVTNASAGACILAANVSTAFTITDQQTGVGSGNFIVQDGNDLTLGIKKLDQEIALIAAALDDPSYDETIDIVASGATPPNSLNGPVSATTVINLPNNSRLSNAVQNYTVGKGVLQFCLNGMRLNIGRDWQEVGVEGDPSNQIEILRDLLVGDALKAEIIVNGGIGSGGGSTGPQGPAGPSGPAGEDAAGGPVSYSVKNANYSVLTSDCFLLADCSSGAVTFTLPPASSNGGRIFYFKKIDSNGSNAMTVAGAGSDMIDGASSLITSTQYQSFSIISYGSSWAIF